jgi:hypothetical protein
MTKNADFAGIGNRVISSLKYRVKVRRREPERTKEP